ncbi:MAG: hypothetical protein GWP10_06270 [Nitrospiraceae bacterium]|nr:hypothetical protein [Nitrospiraceae bacterium]
MSKIAGAYLICPQCRKISVCPCSTCRKLRKQANITEYKEHQWTEDGEQVICPYCGFAGHIDYWCSWAERNNKKIHM